MALFKCSNCGHTQAAQNEFIGRKVKCPHCQTMGNIVDGSTDDEAAASANALGNAIQSMRARIAAGLALLKKVVPSFPLVATILLASSVALQGMILWELRKPAPDREIATVRIDETQTLPVDVTDSCEVNVNVENASYSPIPVSIERDGLAYGLKVSIDDVATTDELNVNLRDHYILSGDPIPVEVSR